MSPRKAARSGPPGAPRARNGRGRQRQRLIDACISALHMYGPSRTTVEKVVAIAKMSPGIVRFYFDSKAAMLVASLQFLAAEFDEQVLLPVAARKATPVAALELLVDLYLDPVIASPRKVSVWYAFWGEASSRQEYYDICGKKDESFAALVRELIEGMIVRCAKPHLDPDGIALGLIGSLEILWQDFAFRTERDIDRVAAKNRCMAYLRSVFPGHFAPEAAGASAAGGRPPGPASWPGWAFADARIHAMERERLFRRAWSAVGHVSQVARAGEYLAADIGTERVLVVRDAKGAMHALRDSCPESPHGLVSDRAGRFEGLIPCRLHGTSFTLDGKRADGSGRAGLTALDLSTGSGLIFARAADDSRAPEDQHAPEDDLDVPPPPALRRVGVPLERVVPADWKIVIEQWLEMSARDAPGGAASAAPPTHPHAWRHAVSKDGGWSARGYLAVIPSPVRQLWRIQFMAPNQLLESRADGLSVIQAVPLGPGRCLLRRLDFSVLPQDRMAHAAAYLARRMDGYSGEAAGQAAASAQKGLVELGYEAAARASPAVTWFRDWLRQAIPALSQPLPPTGP